MKRSAYSKLFDWKQNKDKKPLILKGARQVGKTYLINQFAENEYKNFVYLNFEKKPFLAKYFEKDLSPSKIVSNLELEFNTTIDPNDTLIIFDEIQECSEALTSLKYFCEESDYNVISAGSLLGLELSKGSFPVGKVNFIELFPLSFVEFLEAIGEEKLCQSLVKKNNADQLSENIHLKYMELMRIYFFVGGMPEVVQSYINENNYSKIRDIQYELLLTYSNDFSKHAGKSVGMKVQQVWDSVPKQLAREQKKFKYSEVKKGASSVRYEEAISWLTESGLCHRVNMVNSGEMPLSYYYDSSYFKLLPLDIGILGAMSNLNADAILSEENLFDTFRGAFTELFVGQELKAYGVKKLYYWKSKFMAEVDYLLEGKDTVYPLEVKSGKSGKLKSLNIFSEKYNPKYKIRISSQNFHRRENFLNLPLYGVYYFVSNIL
jgi:predicted AAA+ superfamily ATPase